MAKGDILNQDVLFWQSLCLLEDIVKTVWFLDPIWSILASRMHALGYETISMFVCIHFSTLFSSTYSVEFIFLSSVIQILEFHFRLNFFLRTDRENYFTGLRSLLMRPMRSECLYFLDLHNES